MRCSVRRGRSSAADCRVKEVGARDSLRAGISGEGRSRAQAHRDESARRLAGCKRSADGRRKARAEQEKLLTAENAELAPRSQRKALTAKDAKASQRLRRKTSENEKRPRSDFVGVLCAILVSFAVKIF